MHQQFNIFLLAFGGLQGALLCFLLLRKRVFNAGRLFLLLYLLTLLLQVLMKIVSKVWLMQNMVQVYWVSYDLPYLYGPLLYLFVRQILQPERRFQRVELWHFLPFLYFTLAHLYANTHDVGPLGVLFRISHQTATGLQLLSLLSYHLVSYLLSDYFFSPRRQENEFKVQSSRVGAPQHLVRFLKHLTLASFIVTTVLAVTLCLMYLQYPRLTDLRYLFAAATIFIYWISYQAMRRPELFGLAPVTGYSESNGAGPAVPVNGKKYHNSTLKETDSAVIIANLNRVMQQQRPYLEPELTIDTLAASAGTNRHHLSQVINDRLQKNFYDYLNGYRVKAARHLLSNPGNDHLKIAAIAYDSGFNSLSTFNEVFKKLTGQTPSEFRKSAQTGRPAQQV